VVKCDADAIILTETWLCDGIHSEELFDERYTVFRRDRSANRGLRGGGVLIAVRSTLKAVLLSEFSSPAFESIWIKILLNNVPHYINAVYFRPSTSFETYLQYFELVESFNDIFNNNVMIIGDWNIPEINCSSFDFSGGSRLTVALGLFMGLLGLESYNGIVNCNNRTLDLVLSSFHVNVSRSHDCLVPEDNHHPTLTISFPLFHTRSDHGDVSDNEEHYNFKRANFLCLYESLRDADWTAVYSRLDVNEATEAFYEIIYSCFDQYVPKRAVSDSVGRYPRWYTKDIIRDIKRKERCARKRRVSAYHDEEFRRLRSALKLKISHAYQAYLNSVQSSIEGDMRNFWSYINNNRKGKRLENFMRWNDEFVSGSEIPEAFADYFSSVFNSSDGQAGGFDNSIGYSPFHMNCITITDIVDSIRSLKGNGSVGPDKVPPYVIKGCCDLFVRPLEFIFNLALRTSTFPDLWKQAKVVPIFKAGSRQDVKNYRPISIINCFAKVFEKCIYKKIFNHVKPWLVNNQHGFLPGRSTVTNLLHFRSEVSACLDRGLRVDTVYADLSKAFDTLSHTILFEKLSSFGFSLSGARFILSYLSNRVQFVSFSGLHSKFYSSPSGVPQGSNLGPLLFIIFINDLPSVIKHSSCLLYADDVKIFRVIESGIDCQMLQSDVDNLYAWCLRNKLRVNIDKCALLSFTRQRDPQVPIYRINNQIIKRVDNFKDLGVIFDSELNFNHHVKHLCSRACRQIGFIRRTCSHFDDHKVLILLYKTLVRSLLNYCSEVWHPYLVSQKLELERIQNKFLRFVFFKRFNVFCPFNFPTADLRLIFGMQSLEESRNCKLLVLLYNILNNRTESSYLLSLLNIYVPSVSRRSGFRFLPPQCNSNNHFNSPINRMMNLFNQHSIHLDLFHITLSKFKKASRRIYEPTFLR
jgi:hypothetical protein